MPCEHSRSHIYSPIDLKIGKNVFLHEILDKFSLGHRCQTRSRGKTKEAPCGHSRSYDLCSVDQFSSQFDNKYVLTVFAQLTRKLGQIHLWGN